MPISQLLLHAVFLGRLAAPYPFAVGETLRYDAKLGYLPVGEATVSVTGMAKERGTQAFVFALTGQGGPPGLRVRYDLTSWVGASRFHSLRFRQRLEQAGKVQEHGYVIIPDSARYREDGVPGDWVAPPEALDELAFLYYLRAASLKVGRTYRLNRYFRNGYNPIVVTVGARESIPMPGESEAPCLALTVTTRGLTMRVWLTDDQRRLPAQLEIPLAFGNVTLSLVSSISPGNSRSPSG